MVGAHLLSLILKKGTRNREQQRKLTSFRTIFSERHVYFENHSFAAAVAIVRLGGFCKAALKLTLVSGV